jgi:DNA primase
VSFAATQDAREQVRQATDIVDLVGSYIPLRRQGRIFVGLCPWHDDSRPSLQVNPDRQSWKCWVCNVGGDVFSFAMQREGIDFREALDMLADRAGIVLPAVGRERTSRPGSSDDKGTLYEVAAWAERQFQECLSKSAEAETARRYLADRGINDTSRAMFHLGFSPDRWQWLVDRARSAGYSNEVLEAAGLIGRSPDSGRHYDFFRGRVLFSIRDAQARPIGFGGRILPGQDDPRKYVNTRETRLFSKSEHVYALDLARDAITKSRQAVVVEGYTDVIMAHQCGLKNFVAVLGTALGPRHIRLLRRYADSIMLVLDGDEAGQRRTNEVLELFIESDVDLRVMTLPEGLDPCDFLRKHGAEPMQELLSRAVDALEHALNVRIAGVDLLRDTHRANQALEQLLAILAKAPRASAESTSAKLLRERQLMARLSREFRLDESMLRTRVAELRRAAPVSRRIDPATSIQAENRPIAVSLSDVPPHDAELLEILLLHPELVAEALESVHEEDLRGDHARWIWQAYRKLNLEGISPDFGQILSAVDEPALKKLLVDLDDRGQSREPLAGEDAVSRLRGLVRDMQFRRRAAETTRQIAQLEQRKCDEQQEVALLQQLIQKERERQGITEPTDG